MLRLGVVVGVAAALVAAAFLLLERGTRSGEAPLHHGTGPTGEDRGPTDLAEPIVRRAVRGVETSPPPPDPAEEEVAGTGTVTGTVLDWQGAPLVRHEVLVCQGDDLLSGCRRPALSDELGVYTVEGVPAGTWDVYTGPPTDGPGSSAVHAGSVEVWKDRVSVFDILQEGPRCLVGAVTYGPDLTVGLRLQLRPTWDPGRVVATGWALARPEEEKRPRPEGSLPDGNEDELEPEPPRKGIVSGGFRFCGLAPGSYVLRVILGRDVETGRDVCLEREVDLTEHDVDLGPLVFESWEFARAE